MIKRFGSVLVLACGLVAVSGCCGAGKKLKECAEMTKTINEGITKAKAITVTPATIASFGKVYEETGEKVAKLDISTPEIKAEQAEYVAMTKELAKATKDAASAGASKAKNDVAMDEIKKAAKHESEIVNKLNKTCH